MKFTPKFTAADIRKYVLQETEKLEEAVLLRMQSVGENFITHARTSANFKDRTGNLRSSIGYIILKNGLQYSKGGFVLIKEGSKGIGIGKKVIEEIANRFPTGFVLICVAGMNYAAAVEAKGYDVITGSSVIAVDSLKSAFERLGFKVRA